MEPELRRGCEVGGAVGGAAQAALADIMASVVVATLTGIIVTEPPPWESGECILSGLG